jgi:hypothetical protein
MVAPPRAAPVRLNQAADAPGVVTDASSERAMGPSEPLKRKSASDTDAAGSASRKEAGKAEPSGDRTAAVPTIPEMLTVPAPVPAALVNQLQGPKEMTAANKGEGANSLPQTAGVLNRFTPPALKGLTSSASGHFTSAAPAHFTSTAIAVETAGGAVLPGDSRPSESKTLGNLYMGEDGEGAAAGVPGIASAKLTSEGAKAETVFASVSSAGAGHATPGSGAAVARSESSTKDRRDSVSSDLEPGHPGTGNPGTGNPGNGAQETNGIALTSDRTETESSTISKGVPGTTEGLDPRSGTGAHRANGAAGQGERKADGSADPQPLAAPRPSAMQMASPAAEAIGAGRDLSARTADVPAQGAKRPAATATSVERPGREGSVTLGFLRGAGADPVRQPLEVAAVSASSHASSVEQTGTGTRNAFSELDAEAPSGAVAWTHASGQRAEAGFEDPTLGWVGVRADLNAGAIHASLIPGSAGAAEELGKHMDGLNAFLAEQRTPVHSLAMETATPGARGFDSSGQAGHQGSGRDSSRDSQSGSGEDGRGPSSEVSAMTAAGSRMGRMGEVDDPEPRGIIESAAGGIVGASVAARDSVERTPGTRISLVA